MLRSLYSGVSGMRNFQTKMDVIANNIANVNTTAFKSGRVKFQDLLNQSVASAQAPQAGGRGGVNPQQIGLGVMVGSIDTMMEGGAMQPTNRGLDFAIAGEGFFTVSSDGGATKSYTRDGAFYADYDGNLTNASGLKIMGFGPQEGDTTGRTFKAIIEANPNATPNPITAVTSKEIIEGYTKVASGDPVDFENQNALKVPEKLYKTADGFIDKKPTVTPDEYELQAFNIDGTGLITGVYKGNNGTTDVVETVILGQVSLTTFSNPTGLTKDGGNNYSKSNNSGDPQIGQAGTGSRGVVNQGFLEMSNVDLANEFTEMIVTSRAYQANSRSITTSDEMIQELLNLKR